MALCSFEVARVSSMAMVAKTLGDVVVFKKNVMSRGFSSITNPRGLLLPLEGTIRRGGLLFYLQESW